MIFNYFSLTGKYDTKSFHFFPVAGAEIEFTKVILIKVYDFWTVGCSQFWNFLNVLLLYIFFIIYYVYTLNFFPTAEKGRTVILLSSTFVYI
jgi:hypothetical protein